jgi:hypothetical protein
MASEFLLRQCHHPSHPSHDARMPPLPLPIYGPQRRTSPGGISRQPHVTACLASHSAMALEALSQELTVDVPRKPHRASSSCLT